MWSKQDSNNGYTKVDREKSMGFQPYTKNYGQLRKAGVGDVVFPREKHTISYQVSSGQPWQHVYK